MRLSPILAVIALLLASPVLADEVTDKLQAALLAYEGGDLKTASAALAEADGLLSARKSTLLVELLPEAPEGWTKTINTDYATGLSAAGGGTGAEARYDHEDGSTITVNVLMDSPLMAMMMGMFANPQMMSMMGKTVEVNGTTLLDQDTSLITVVDERMMVTLNGAESAKLVPFAQGIDFAALAEFDSPK